MSQVASQVCGPQAHSPSTQVLCCQSATLGSARNIVLKVRFSVNGLNPDYLYLLIYQTVTKIRNLVDRPVKLGSPLRIRTTNRALRGIPDAIGRVTISTVPLRPLDGRAEPRWRYQADLQAHEGSRRPHRLHKDPGKLFAGALLSSSYDMDSESQNEYFRITMPMLVQATFVHPGRRDRPTPAEASLPNPALALSPPSKFAR